MSPDRIDLDFAIEFGGYLAATARRLADKVAGLSLESLSQEDLESLTEAMSDTRRDIYEFEKRRDRVAKSGAQLVAEHDDRVTELLTHTTELTNQYRAEKRRRQEVEAALIASATAMAVLAEIKERALAG